jgi:hypothetical protein
MRKMKMIKTKVDSMGKQAITQDLEMKGSTTQILVELKSLTIGVLNSMDITRRKDQSEMTLDDRIELFCQLLKNVFEETDEPTKPTTDESDRPTIDDWEYHCRMLSDIAKRNEASLVMRYDPEPANPSDNAITAVTGSGKDMLIALCSLIDDAAHEGNIKPSELADMVSFFVNEHEKANNGREADE